jgi:SAM-dependent methyltransferase
MGGVPEFALPPCDEPVDFRHQAAIYSRYRRDYSPALYDAIEARTGPPGGRPGLDLGCGTGFVSSTLRGRGWRVVGVDFSAPMLAQAGTLGRERLAFVRARAETLPLRDGAARLVTCGTAFHWFAPAPTLAELRRVLAPGGWVALFWRYNAASEPYMRLVGDLLRELGAAVPAIFHGIKVHPEEPFQGSGLEAVPPLTLASELEFSAESYLGYVSTLEWVRRFAGPRHAELLIRLRAELLHRWPGGFRERNEEYLFLARRP